MQRIAAAWQWLIPIPVIMALWLTAGWLPVVLI